MIHTNFFKKTVAGLLIAAMALGTPTGVMGDEPSVNINEEYTFAEEQETEPVVTDMPEPTASPEVAAAPEEATAAPEETAVPETSDESGVTEDTADQDSIDKPDATADLEDKTVWEESLPEKLANVEKSKAGEEVKEADYRADIVNVARSQRGYRESEKNYVLDENGNKKHYNRYGVWAGEDEYADPWDLEFVEFVFWYSGIKEETGFDEAGLLSRIPADAYDDKNEGILPVDPENTDLLKQIVGEQTEEEKEDAVQDIAQEQETAVPYDDDTAFWTWKLAQEERYRTKDYEAKAGDVVFLMEEDGTFHAGIITDRGKEKVVRGGIETEIGKLVVTAATVGEERDEVKEFEIETTDKRIYAYGVVVDEDHTIEQETEQETEQARKPAARKTGKKAAKADNEAKAEAEDAIEWPDNMITKELTAFNGNLATYRIVVNPDAKTLSSKGDPYVLKDTFSANQSINYGSVKIGGSADAEDVSYDFSGQTGTYTIPDGAKVTITYTTRVSGTAGEPAALSNTAEVGRMEGSNFVPGPSAVVNESKTISPTGTDISGTGGVYSIQLFAYADGHMERGLDGAEFRLLDQNMRPMHYLAGENSGKEIRFTTNENGYVDIALDEAADGLTIRKNTAYYLEMTTAPFEILEGQYIYYRKDNGYYSFLITDEPSYKYGEIYSYFNGDILKVRCYPEAGGVNVTKRFSGNYELTEDQKNAITFTLQKQNGTNWQDVKSHTYSEFSYGSLNFDINASDLEDGANYRMVETKALPNGLKGIVELNATSSVTYQMGGEPIEDESGEFLVDPDDKTQVSYSFTFTNEYVDHKLTIVNLDEMTGTMLPKAQFAVYAAADMQTPIETYVTDEDGIVTIRKTEKYQTDTLYCAVETAAPEDYVLPDTPERIYFYFSENSVSVPDGLPSGTTATDLSTSYNTVTVANSSALTTVPVTVSWGLDGNDDWPEEVKSVEVGLYQSVNGSVPAAVQKAGEALTVTLTKERYYDKTTFTDLPVRDDNGHTIAYSVVEERLNDTNGKDVKDTYASNTIVSGTGWYVINHQPAVSVTVKKTWVQNDGTTKVSDTGGYPDVNFALYRLTTDVNMNNMEREDLLRLLGSAAPVRTGLSLSYANDWTLTINALEKTDSAGNTWYYYALESVPDNQIDTYSVTAATKDNLRTLTIQNQQTPSTVTIKAEDLSKVYGAAELGFVISAAVSETDGSESVVTVSGPDGSGQYTAVVTKANGERADITFTVSRIEGEDVGSYAITPAGENQQAGYRVLFEPGTLTVNPACVTVRAGAEKVYGASDPESLVTLFLNDESITKLDGITYTATREEGEDVGEYAITLSGEETQGNYAVTFESGTLTITPASATVTAMNAAKIYGEDDPEFAATVTGLRNGDSEEVIAYELTREAGEDVNSYTISPTGAEVQGNYTVSFVPGTLTIGRAGVTIAVADAEKVYGTEDPDWEIVIDGLIGDDAGGTMTVAADGQSFAYQKSESDTETLFAFEVKRAPGENVGDYVITASGAADQGNYTVSFAPGTLTIMRAELTVHADEIVKAVGVAADPLLTAKVTGWANGDDGESEVGHVVSGSGVTWTYTRNGDEILTFTLTRESGEEEGDYDITVSGAEEQSNYTVIYESGTLKILSKFDVIVTQTVQDPVDATASPIYSYKATVDLTDSGLSGSYNDNGFVNGVQTFTLPDQAGEMRKVLIIPAGASVEIEQTTENADYIDEVTEDGKATGSENKWEIASLDDHYYLGFIHTRIGLSIRTMTTAEGTEEDATAVSGSTGYIGIPDEVQSIDASFAEDFQNRVGYVLPSDKYYSYDHASLYSADGEAISGAIRISAIRYDKENAAWQYSVDGDSYVNAPLGVQLTLFYIPKYICKIGDERFYTLNAAMGYVANQNDKTAIIEMLIGEYVMPASDPVTIPAGYDITITTANEGYEGSSGTAAVIRRSAAFTSAAMFTNNGKLTLDNITLDGNGGKVTATHAMVVNGTDTSVLTVREHATLQNASGNEGGAIYVNKKAVTTIAGKLLNNTAAKGGALFMAGSGQVTFEGKSALEGNSATSGGAVYMDNGTLTLSGAVSKNRATNGGAAYMNNGTATLSGTVSENSAINGGAVYMNNGTATLSGAVSENRATNGGAVYMTNDAKFTLSGAVTENSATNGGAVYMTKGTATLSGAVSENSATNGGAVYMTSGTANVTGTISGNAATGSGGAYYIEGGTLNITDGVSSNNSATKNGGMLYGTNGTVTISAGTFNGNKATGNGGVICYGGSNTVTIKGGTFTGNSANYGGVVYQSAGTVTLSAGTMGGTDDGVANCAKNGSAVYATGGVTTLSGVTIRGNAASEGGAVGFGSASAQVTFSGDTVVSGNTMGEETCNVYLDIDSDQVINSVGLGGSANIGIYVSDGLLNKHGDMGMNFGSWATTSESNVRKFVNDRHDYLVAWFANSRLIWSAPLTYNVRDVSAFQNNQLKDQFPPTNQGSQLKGDTVYYPHSATNRIYDLVTEIGYNNANRVYACSFALKATDWNEFLTSVDWDSNTHRWVFKHGDTNVMKDGTNNTIYIYYSEAAYISITNNSGYDLKINPLTVMGRDVVAMNYGYPTVVNYRTQETLYPIADASNVVKNTDIVVQNGGYVKLLFPGACTRTWSMSGSFVGADGSISCTLDSLNNTETQTIENPNAFTLNGTTLANGYTYDILFGAPSPICKVVDADGEHPFPTLNKAWDYIKEQNLTTAAIQMLMDYLQPGKDVLKIDKSDYNITLTTAAASGGTYNYTGDGISDDGSAPRATISRDTDNDGAAIIYDAESDSDSSLTITNLTFDGKALAKESNGGAISTRNCEVVIDNSQFKGYRATRGGAVFVSHGGKNDGQKDEEGDLLGGLKITNSTFSDCRSAFNQDKAGGGAVWTTAKYLTVRGCTFIDCACMGTTYGQGGAVFHNIVDGKTFPFKEFDYDRGNAAYASGYSAGTKSVIMDCKFYDCYVMGSAGGALETDAQDVVVGRCEFHNCRCNSQHGGGALIDYARDQKEPDASWPCTLEIYDTIFDNCRSENASYGNNNGSGGVVRTTARDNTFTNCVFTDAMCKDRGGAIAVSSQNANSLVIKGCAFENCVSQCTDGGGAIFCPVVILKVGDYVAPDGTVTHTTFQNCTAIGSGGAIRQAKNNNAGSSATLENCGFEDCTSTNGAGGALCSNAKVLSLTGSSEDEKVLFKNCTASGDGGAIKHSDGSPTSSTISNCAFEACTSGVNGGAVNLGAVTITVTDVSVTDCTAVNYGGGMGLWPGGGGATVTNCSFKNNSLSASTSKGGSLYLQDNNVTLSNVSVANSTAADGGGIYKGSGTLYLKETTISNCKATISGGGVYNGTTTMEGGSKITGCYAPQGGGFYSTKQLTIKTGGDAIIDCHARNVSIAADGTVTVAEATTAGNEGGGIYRSGGKLLMEDEAGASNIKECTAYDGGGIYYNTNTDFNLRYGSVSGNSASHDGGGIYMNIGALNLTTGAANNNATISDNTAGNNGGGVYQAAANLKMYNNGSISGNTAKNGGGVYHAAGTFTMMNAAAIAGNTAENNGGGVYHAGGTFTMSGGIIGGAEGNGNKADNGGGVYVADGQTMTMNNGTNSEITYNAAATEGGGVAVGSGSMLNFISYVTVRHNALTGDSNVENNVHLNQDSNAVIRQTGNLTAASYIGVYCSDDQDPTHGYSGMPFGTYTTTNTTNIERFFNDRRPYLYGVKGASNSRIIWATFVCKITDSEDNMLYKDNDGTPALYEKLENNDNKYITSAFGILSYSDHRLYTASGERYEGAYKIQMYVQEYTAKWKIEVKTGKTITLTTASAEADECKLRYDGDLKHPYATIIRDANYGRMFQLNDSQGCTLNLTGIVLDGGSEAGYKANEGGGILFIGIKDAVVMGANATLRNSNSNNQTGAAVYIKNANSSLTMNDGAMITRCVTTGNGGGVCVNNGTFTMNGGTIAECSANNGGGVYLGNTNTAKLVMSGGTITGCNASSAGGAVATGGMNARMNFSGNPVVMGNTLNTLNGTTACNVHLNYNNNNIINASGLAADAEIGIYTTGEKTNAESIYSTHGLEGTPFGTWSLAWTDGDNPQCFVNDRNDELRGSRGAQDSQLIYWAQNYRLEIDAKVVSDLTADHNKTFSYTVTIASDDVKKKTFSDVKFDADGRGVVTLKDGQTITFYFPEALKDADYTVTLTDKDADNYTTAVQSNAVAPANVSTTSGKLGENLSNEPPSGLSVVTFTHERVTGDLKIGKTVVSTDAGDEDTSFPFVVTLRDAGINKNYEMVRNTGAAEITEEITFQAGVARVELSDSENVTIADLPTDLGYTVAEDLSDFPDSNRIRTMVSKNAEDAVTAKSVSGTLGEIIEGNRAVSTLAFTNNYLEIVCKITNRNRALLYYAESGGKLVPAIFDNLAEAFARINAGGLKTASGGTASGALRVEMVVADYTLNDVAVLNKGKTVVLSTALTTDDDGYPYTGEEDTTAMVTRGTLTGCMIEDSGSLTLDKIVLDGGSALDTPVNVEADGGIVRVNSAVTLTVSSGAMLQNSTTTGNGGAIWMGSGASLNLSGNIQNCAAANGGGVYADNGFKKIGLYGAVTDCEATADGAGLSAGTGSSGITLYEGAILAGNKATGNGGGLYSLANVVLRGMIGGDGSQSNTAKNGGGLYMGNGAMLTMYSTGSINGNTAKDNGGGLYTLATARIAGGAITDNSAQGNGGGVYGGESSTVTISSTAVTINENSASGRGGAVYADGSLSMSGGSLTSNSARVSGGAVYLAAGKTFTMTGGSITGGNRSPEGAVSTGEDSVLAFSGKATVTGNTAYDGTAAMNVYLGYDSNAVITTSGLSSAATIGVYAADGEENSIYYGHGIAARNFGTYTGTNAAIANLNKFVNDRDEELYGLAGAASDGGVNLIWHGRDLILTVYKYGTTEALANVSFTLTNAKGVRVWSGKSSASGLVTIPWGVSEVKDGNAASFEAGVQYVLRETASNNDTVRPAGSWTMTVGSDNSVTWTTTATEGEQNQTLDIKSKGTVYIGDTGFALYNDVQPKLTLNANGGTLYGKMAEISTETIQFTTTETSHQYTLKEENPIQSSSVFVRWATAASRPEDYDGSASKTDPDYKEYQKGDTITWYRNSENDDLTLYAQWDSVVCKITDNSGRLLYVDGNPAVYATLEEGFYAFNSERFTTSSGTNATPRQIQMLKKTYTLTEPVAVARRNARNSYNYALLTTASANDTDGYPGPFDGSDTTVCVITRGNDDEPMITNNASLVLTNIALDGDGHRDGREKDRVVVCDGGIVNNALASAALTITEGATLRNSWVEGYGGAVHAKASTKVYFTGGTISGNSCRGTSANGAGIYLAEGSSLYLSGNPDFGGTDTYTKADKDAGNIPAGKDVGDLKGTDGNFVLKEEEDIRSEEGELLNGGREYVTVKVDGKDYYKVRQDICLAGYAGEEGAVNAAAVNVSDKITSGDGSIWIWADEMPHYRAFEQFAVLTGNALNLSAEEKENMLKAFRNARDDIAADNGTDTYLFGTMDDDKPGYICWNGSKGNRKVILRKVASGSYEPLSGAKFTVYRGNSSAPYSFKNPEQPEEKIELKDLESQKSGIIWIGELPYGIYYLNETAAPVAPAGYAGNEGKWFYVIVDETGIYASGNDASHTGGYSDQAEAREAAAAKNTEISSERKRLR